MAKKWRTPGRRDVLAKLHAGARRYHAEAAEGRNLLRRIEDIEATIFADVRGFPQRPGAKAPAGYRVANRGKDAGEVYLYGAIGASFWGDGISADQFRKDLKALGAVKTIDVRINSEGGDVFDGKAMYSLLVEHPATVTMHIDGLAASAASFIAMAGNSIEIAEGAFVMIHNASGMCFGGAEDMRRTADLLETVNGTLVDVYAARTKQSAADVRKWMSDETWMTGKEAVEKGFADKVVENLKVAASVGDPTRFRNLPQALRPKRAAAAATVAAMKAAISR